jgi:hypothetical protein
LGYLDAAGRLSEESSPDVPPIGSATTTPEPDSKESFPSWCPSSFYRADRSWLSEGRRKRIAQKSIGQVPEHSALILDTRVLSAAV